MEQISDGFSIEYRDDGIMVYHVLDLRRETIDAIFAASTRHDREYFAQNRHLRRMFWLKSTSLMPTPYSLHKLIEAEKLTPRELRESFALILTNVLSYQIMSLFMNRNLPAYTRSISRIFQDEARAVAWLDERLSELGE